MPSDAHLCDSREQLFPICPSRKVLVASRLQGLSEGANEPGIKARDGLVKNNRLSPALISLPRTGVPEDMPLLLLRFLLLGREISVSWRTITARNIRILDNEVRKTDIILVRRSSVTLASFSLKRDSSFCSSIPQLLCCVLEQRTLEVCPRMWSLTLQHRVLVLVLTLGPSSRDSIICSTTAFHLVQQQISW